MAADYETFPAQPVIPLPLSEILDSAGPVLGTPIDDAVTHRLAVGDRLTGPPCVVTIDTISIGGLAYGRCETCDDRHVIDGLRYEAGHGPWRETDRHPRNDVSAVISGSTGDQT